jgi:pyruvate dehydrogenase E2 component (dihydrolipoamide acetyltransferase)
LLRRVAEALVQHPLLNSHWVEGELRTFRQVNLAIGIATEHGLVAPVLHGVERMDVSSIGAALAELRDRAAAQRLRPQDLEQGTFTVSNLGPFGVDELMALVTPPQVAALAVGAVDPAGQWSLTLSADHRAVDGADAARFLASVCELVQNG